MTVVTHRNRQPAGVSTGGQFAVEPRTETQVSLTEAGHVDSDVDSLQAARTQAQARWRRHRDDLLVELMSNEARDDVEVLAMHVLARSVLQRYPSAATVVLRMADTGDRMHAVEVRDADGATLTVDADQVDPFEAAADLRFSGKWRVHATDVSPDFFDPRIALDVRAVAQAPVELSDRESALVRSLLRVHAYNHTHMAEWWAADTRIGEDGREVFTGKVTLGYYSGQQVSLDLTGTPAGEALAAFEAEHGARPLSGNWGDRWP